MGCRMRIESIHVRNFRCILDQELPLENHTVLVGSNGSGKSSFIQALRVFYDANAKLSEEDFYNRDTKREIVIKTTFTGLTDKEKELFEKRIRNERLTVEKIVKWKEGKPDQRYYASALRNPDFDPFRHASGPGLKAEYNNLKEGEYCGLPPYSGKEKAEEALRKWEGSNPDQCVDQREEYQFFGYRNVGESKIEKNTLFVFVPAVREASQDAADTKGTTFTEIMDLLVRSVLEQRPEIVDLRRRTEEQYEKIVDPDGIPEMQELVSDLDSTLKRYVPDAGLQLTWQRKEIDIPMPQADIKLWEHGYLSSVERCGHGLQRAFILTLLQHLVLAKSAMQETAEDKGTQNANSTHTPTRPSLIIAIEEPELYQHPCRQRHLSQTFHKLTEPASNPTTQGNIQIIYSTHSPLFVDIGHFDRIRVLRKAENRQQSDMPKHTEVTYTKLENVAKRIRQAERKEDSSSKLARIESKLLTIMTPLVNEGFFANLAVLVEGEKDRLAVITVAEKMGHDLNGLGVSVIPCMGKNNLDRPMAIFCEFAIQVYLIWDSDMDKTGANYKDNYRLLRLCNQPEEKWPEKVESTFACFQKDLDFTLREDIGEQFYNTALDRCCTELQIDKNSPQVLREIINEAYQQGKTSQTLENIVSQIVAGIDRP